MVQTIGKGGSSDKAPVHKAKLLAVDDSSLVIDLIKFALRNVPIKVFGHTRVDSGLKLLEDDHFSLIITDLKMPGVGGIDFLKQIRKMPVYLHTPILVVSGYEDKSFIDEAFAAGATDFIAKPFTSNDILEFVVREMRQKKKKALVTVAQAALGQP